MARRERRAKLQVMGDFLQETKPTASRKAKRVRKSLTVQNGAGEHHTPGGHRGAQGIYRLRRQGAPGRPGPRHQGHGGGYALLRRRRHAARTRRPTRSTSAWRRWPRRSAAGSSATASTWSGSVAADSDTVPRRVAALEGAVVRAPFGVGSKSEREAVWLETADRRFVLRRKDGSDLRRPGARQARRQARQVRRLRGRLHAARGTDRGPAVTR